MIKKIIYYILSIAMLGLLLIAYENNQNWKALRKAADGTSAREIMLAVLSYQNDNAGLYPLSIESLVELGRIDKKTISSRQALKKNIPKPHFIYIYPGAKSLKPNDPVIYLRELCNEDGSGKTIVCFADGHYEYVEISKFGLTSL